MQSNSQNAAGRATRRVYLLSGLIYCSCGSAMAGNTVTKHGKKYAYYECGAGKRTKTCSNPAVSASWIEQAVIEALYDQVLGPNAIDDLIEDLMSMKDDRANEQIGKAKGLKLQLGKVEVEVKRIIDAVKAGLYHEGMNEEMNQLSTREKALREQIERAERDEALAGLTRDDIKKYLTRFGGIREASPAKKKEIVREFVSRVVVSPNGVDVHTTARVTKPRSPDADSVPENVSGFGYEGSTCWSTSYKALPVRVPEFPGRTGILIFEYFDSSWL